MWKSEKQWYGAGMYDFQRAAIGGNRIMVLVCALAFALAAGSQACRSRAPEYTVVEPHGEFLELKVLNDSPSSVHFYTYKSNGRNVNFFVRKDRDGALHAHFDACYSCFKYKMGYVVEGNRAVCRACRLEFDLSEPIWDFIGPCVPITLSSKASSGTILIRKGNLERGGQFF